MNSRLRELQENLQAYLLTGNLKIAGAVANPKRDRIDARLAIYRDGYYLSLINQLKKDFALLVKLMGKKAFDNLAMAYIEKYPSSYFSINDVGQNLPSYLSETSPYNQQLYLSELAQFIQALDYAMTAADAAVLQMNDLAIVPPEQWSQLQLKTHPSVKLLYQQFNVFAIWQTSQQSKTLPKAERLLTGNYCLIWRKGLMSYSLILTAEAACLLKAFQVNKSFAEVCEGLTEYLPPEEVAQYTVNQLKNWLNLGIFSQLKY